MALVRHGARGPSPFGGGGRPDRMSWGRAWAFWPVSIVATAATLAFYLVVGWTAAAAIGGWCLAWFG